MVLVCFFPLLSQLSIFFLFVVLTQLAVTASQNESGADICVVVHSFIHSPNPNSNFAAVDHPLARSLFSYPNSRILLLVLLVPTPFLFAFLHLSFCVN